MDRIVKHYRRVPWAFVMLELYTVKVVRTVLKGERAVRP